MLQQVFGCIVSFVNNVRFLYYPIHLKIAFLLIQACFICLLLPVYPLFLIFQYFADKKHKRKLEAKESQIIKTMIEESFPRPAPNLSKQMHIVSNQSLICKIYRYFDKSPIAFTLGTTIYNLSRKKLDLNVISHEAIHTIQFEEFGGIVPMLSDYFAHFFVLLSIHKDWHTAYMNIPQEIEAYKYEIEGER